MLCCSSPCCVSWNAERAARLSPQIYGIQRNMLKPEATAPLVEHDGIQATLENTQEVGQGVEAPIAGDP